MGSDKTKAYNALGRDEFLWFDPTTLTIVEDDPSHPLFDPDRVNAPVDEGFVRNIMKFGVKETILVRLNGRDGKTDLPIVEVIDGRQRVRGALEANKRLAEQGAKLVRVPGKCERGGTDAEIMGIMVFTNEIRKTDGPLAKARKAKRLLDVGQSMEEVVLIFGVHKKTVEDWLSLLQCDDKVQQAVERSELSADIARKMVALPRAEQRSRLDEMRQAGTMKGRAAEAAIKPRSSPEAKGNGQSSNGADEDAAPVIPSRRNLRRMLNHLVEAGGDETAVNLLAFVLDGKPLRGDLRKAWRTSQKDKAGHAEA